MATLLTRCSLLYVLVLAVAADSAQCAEVVLAGRAEVIAAALPWLSLDDALHDRDPGRECGEGWEKVASAWGELRAVRPEDSAAEALAWIRPLLSHRDPKVRTLGIVFMAGLDRLDVLPDVAALVGDHAATYDEPRDWDCRAVGREARRQCVMDPHVVGDYALGVIERYVQASHELKEQRLPYENPAALVARLRAFAAVRDPRLATAALRVAMDTATGGTYPLQESRKSRVMEVERRIGELPMPRRFFVSLAVDSEPFFYWALYRPSYLLDLARQVPREVRWSVLRGSPPADDPDLEPGFGSAFLLDHAVDLFRASDVDPLLLLSAATRKGGSDTGVAAKLVVAAAMIEPRRAEAILVPALADFSGRWQQRERGAIALALAELGSDAGLGKALEWFFSEPPQPGSSGERVAFLAALHDAAPQRCRQAVARIVRDARLSTLGPPSTCALVRSVEGYLGLRLATNEQLRFASLYDESGRDGRPDTLVEWQRTLRETVSAWE